VLVEPVVGGGALAFGVAGFGQPMRGGADEIVHPVRPGAGRDEQPVPVELGQQTPRACPAELSPSAAAIGVVIRAPG
jgi:hypothetical protein